MAAMGEYTGMWSKMVGAVARATHLGWPEPCGSKEKVSCGTTSSRAREGESLGRGEGAARGAARVLLCGIVGAPV